MAGEYVGTVAQAEDGMTDRSSEAVAEEPDTAAEAMAKTAAEPPAPAEEVKSTKAPRWNITKLALHKLELVFLSEKFPSVETREALAAQLAVTPRQVQVWFQNKRQRSLRAAAAGLLPEPSVVHATPLLPGSTVLPSLGNGAGAAAAHVAAAQAAAATAAAHAAAATAAQNAAFGGQASHNQHQRQHQHQHPHQHQHQHHQFHSQWAQGGGYPSLTPQSAALQLTQQASQQQAASQMQQTPQPPLTSQMQQPSPQPPQAPTPLPAHSPAAVEMAQHGGLGGGWAMAESSGGDGGGDGTGSAVAPELRANANSVPALTYHGADYHGGMPPEYPPVSPHPHAHAQWMEYPTASAGLSAEAHGHTRTVPPGMALTLDGKAHEYPMPDDLNSPGLSAQLSAAEIGEQCPGVGTWDQAAGPGGDPRRKQRFIWSSQMHMRFEAAVHKLGVDQAKPQAISQLMGCEREGAPTTQNIKSHLQKYRLLMQKRRAGIPVGGGISSMPPLTPESSSDSVVDQDELASLNSGSSECDGHPSETLVHKPQTEPAEPAASVQPSSPHLQRVSNQIRLQQHQLQMLRQLHMQLQYHKEQLPPGSPEEAAAALQMTAQGQHALLQKAQRETRAKRELPSEYSSPIDGQSLVSPGQRRISASGSPSETAEHEGWLMDEIISSLFNDGERGRESETNASPTPTPEGRFPMAAENSVEPPDVFNNTAEPTSPSLAREEPRAMQVDDAQMFGVDLASPAASNDLAF